MTTEAAKYLKLLMGKIREKNVEIEKSIVSNEADENGDEGSASGSGSGGNVIVLFCKSETVNKRN